MTKPSGKAQTQPHRPGVRREVVPGFSPAGKFSRCLGVMFCLLTVLSALGQGPLLLRETFTREYSIFVGGNPAAPYQQVVSRETSMFVGTDSVKPYPQTISREASLLIQTPATPDRLTQLKVSLNPTGDAATLDFTGYNEPLQRDVTHYLIYLSSSPITNVTGSTPYLTVPAGAQLLTISNLTVSQHYFAVVAVDSAGNYDPVVNYAGGYLLSAETFSREFCVFVGGNQANPYPQAISREMSLVVTTPAVPDQVAPIVTSTPTGNGATLDWRAYNEPLEKDVLRYDIYISSQPFTNVLGMTPYVSVPAGAQILTVSNLTAFQDHFFAVVAVDAAGGFNPSVNYSAAYVLTAQTFSRETSIFVGGNQGNLYPQVISRETSIVVPDDAVPDPVTGVNSGFAANTSVSAFSAIDLDWSNYDEAIQHDIVRYRVYVSTAFFTDVSGMTPYIYAPAGNPHFTVGGLHGGNIYYVAVTAEDALGNFNPAVRSVSAQASVGALGDVQNLQVTSASNSLHFVWVPPQQVDAFLAHYNVYFNGSTNPVTVAPAATSYDATSLQFATGYHFRITTVDTFGTESAGVSTLAATLLGNPSPVTPVPLGGIVRLNWKQVEPNNLVQTYNVYESPGAFSDVTSLTPVQTTRGSRADVSGLVNGTSYFFAVTTVNIDGGENKVVQAVTAAPQAVVGNFADLAISNVLAPSSAYSGQIITINWAVTNAGAGATSARDGTPVGVWNDQVVLSLDGVFGDADDLILTNVTHSNILNAASGYVVATTLQVPTNLVGDFYVYVLANADGAVFENLDQATNLGLAAHQLEISPPVPPSITQQPQAQSVYLGATVSFSVTAQGSQPLLYQWHHGATNIPTATSATLTLTNVQFSDAGSYFVQVSNIAGSTNSATAMLTVSVPPPDLLVSSLQSPSTILAGQPVPVSWVVTNSGLSTANAPWQEQLFVANNPAGANPTLVLTISISNSLAASNAATRSPSVIFPSGLSGNYWLAVLVDSANQVAEGAGETNNYFVSPTPVLIQAPDLYVSSISSPPTAVLGQSFNASWVITNQGNGAAIPSWNDRVYLSTNINLGPGATPLQTVAAPVNPLPAGASYTNSSSLTVPFSSQSQAGSYWLIVQADADNSVTEFTKANNTLSQPITLTVPPLPDLVVGQVTSPSQAAAGAAIPVSWSVTNIGFATISNSWRESVYLIPSGLTLAQFSTNVAAYPVIGEFTYTNLLTAGAGVARNEQASIPLTGPAGALQVAVFVDSENNVPEQNESNNIALAQNIITVPATLSLVLPVTNVLENTPTPGLNCLVQRNGSLSSPLVVSLSSSATNHLTVPATVTIPAGAGSAAFTATVHDDGVPDASVPVTITAQAGGYTQAASSIFVVNTDLPHLALSLPSQITEGQTLNATVSSDTTMNQPVVVTISSSNPSRLSAPATVTIPANSNSVVFALLAVDNTTIDPTTLATLSASAAAFASSAGVVTILDNDAPQLTLALDRTNISEGDGPFAAVGTITRIPVTDQPVTVALASSNTAAALVPATITIPALQSQANFYVAAVADNLVTGVKTSLLSAQSLDVAGNPAGPIATEQLFVQDTNGPALTLTLSNKIVAKGVNPATTATVSRNTPATSNLVVNLSSSASNEVTIPSVIVISNGQSSATFPIASLNDGIANTNESVTITASATNFASDTEVLMITDLGLPDLFVSSVTAPPTAFTGEPLTISFRLLNQGLGPLTNAVTQNVYLTPALNSGTNLLVGSASFSGPLAAGQFSDQFIVVPGSAVPPPGNYWVIVVADTANSAAELNELNNETISATPVAITLEYTATVKAGVTNVPAGTPVPLTGSATLVAGGPAANKPVNILLTVRGLQRVISVTTDSSGNFSTLFTPLDLEAGMYTVAAVAPGITSAPAQDQFTILGATLSPNPLSVSVIEAASANPTVMMQNLSEIPLTGLTAFVVGAAANLNVNASFLANTLPGQGAATLMVHVSAINATIRQSSFTVHITSAEGVALDLSVNVSVVPLVAQLSSAPPQLSAAMLRAAQTTVQFEIVNLGGAASGPLTVSAPAVPWLGIASTNPLPSLAPGASNLVTILLTPAPDLPLGLYTGALTVSGSGIGLTVPFSFNCVSDGHGSLLIHSVDELSFFATNTPPLTNASVTLIDPLSRAVVATGSTDTNGLFLITNVMEGIYELDVTADHHSSFKGSATVTAAITNKVETFLSFQTVTFTWTVVPTQVQDVTHITVQAEFEANVPAPVVVPSPASLDLAALQQPGQFMDVPLTLANYGLIAVHGVTINISDNPNYQFDFLTKNIGDLPAHGTVTVPVRITRLANTGFRLNAGDPCTVSLSIGYLYLCGINDVSTGIPIPVFNVTGDCGTGGGGGGTVVLVGCPNCSGGPVVIPPGQSSPSDCDQCMAKAILECAIGYTPAGCPYGVWSCVAGLSGGLNATSGENCVVQGVGCLGPIGNTAACLWSFLRCKCSGALSTVPACVANALGGGSSTMDLTVGDGLSPVDPRDVFIARSYPAIHLIQMILADTDGHWFSPGSGGAFGAFFNGFVDAVQSGSASGILISPDEFTNLMTLPRPDTVSATDVQNMLNRWNLTINNWRAGIYSVTNVPPGGNTNFISIYDFAVAGAQIGQQYQIAQSQGYADPVAGFFTAIQNAESKLGGGGTCAKVVLQLNQDAVLTRDAFNATLQLNNSGSDPLQNVSVNLIIRNASGQDVTSLFGVESPTFTGALGAVNGTGVLQPNASGAAQWILIPTVDAAPQVPTNYFVSGSLNYTLNGVSVSLPLSPASITVQPNPQLYVKYFHQRDVFADDPRTPEIEPSIPYSLAVMVQNHGYGIAHDFKITSAQPQIVDNEKGLLVDFKIIGGQVGNQAVSPSLTVDFGDIYPGATVVGRWLLTSTLQGLFINYSATFQHVDPLGNPRLSLIDGVEIHEMNHLVRAEGAWDDGLPDFLVNDIADFDYLPDTLYLSDGRIEPISVVQSATPDAPGGVNHLMVQLSATFPAGFAYLQIPDPANGQVQLVSVIHSSGTNMLTNNFWTTDRTFIGLGQPPIRENILHLFDYHTNAGPDTYTLVYASPSSVPQTNPPVSAVFALPAFSPATFGVVWSGANFVGQAPLAYYDIYASDNNAPFYVWQSHTTDTGGLYTGLPGHTYAFYSVATDTAGNVEAPPATPDAVTTVTLSNTAPSISFPSNLVTINEGNTLSIAPNVSDPDLPPESFTFSLVPGAPAGVTVNPSTGLVTWPTTELDGPSTNTIRVVVTDNGFPPLSSTGIVSVVVAEVNQAPILSPLTNYTIPEGFLLRVTNSAVDYDIPTNILTFSFGGPAPAGAVIDPATGLFQWRPDDTQGPSTNVIAIKVTDNGVPPLSATQTFSVTVLNTLSDLTLTIGSTNVLSGESNTLPLILAASLQLTNVNLQLTAPSGSLTNLALRGVSSEVSGISLNPAGSNTYTVNFNLNPALQTASLRSIATLDFVTISNYHSAIARLSGNQMLASDNTGRAITNGAVISGKVIIVGREPVLDITGGVPPKLTLYGRPGAIYGLDYSTNLLLGTWTPLMQVTQTNRAITFVLSNSALSSAFFEALEIKAEPPRLSINPIGNSRLNLQLNGWSGVLYGVETSSKAGPGSVWSPVTQFRLTNSSQTILWTNQGEQERFFRGTVP